ncbi:hypothetical protein KM043_003012 [Ampulex compressa]|nr:hypothetical protein KM043_003012 [Ampulex compressa]
MEPRRITEEASPRSEASLSRKLQAGLPARKSTDARRRWRILARALTGSPEERPRDRRDEEISVRRFTSFELLKTVLLENVPADPESRWYEYSVALENELAAVQIRRISKSFTANELVGFNNTGNVCVWPSEECLAYYLLKNRLVCRNRRILELGGGMSCLAGILAAKYCNPSAVALTDGNATSVENVRCIVARNDMEHLVDCGLVQWARAARLLRQAEANGNRLKRWTSEGEEMAGISEGQYDLILCADCLFFDEARLDLVETIYGWLADDGLALVMAPRRGTTFKKFAEAAIGRGFIARQTERYDGKIWSRHLELLESSQEYCPDLHYPVLLELTKQKKTPPG